jgi:hypothetical protein
LAGNYFLMEAQMEEEKKEEEKVSKKKPAAKGAAASSAETEGDSEKPATESHVKKQGKGGDDAPAKGEKKSKKGEKE